MKKGMVKILILVVYVLAMIMIVFFISDKNKYDVNQKISNYNVQSNASKNVYIDFLKQYVKPQELQKFVNNDYINFSQYTTETDGNMVVKQLEFNAYKRLFTSMFNRDRTNFDDCPVTKNFKDKFNSNLLDYFKLKESEDCESMCSLYRKDKEIIVEVYGNFKNTEPTYWTKHHFHYTLDDEGNVDDIVFDHTDK